MTLPPIPRYDPLVDKEQKITATWDAKWLQAVVQGVEQSPFVLAHVVVSASGAGVAVTPFVPAERITTAFYRVSYALRIVRAGTVSSSVQFLVEWTAGGIAQAELFTPAMTGNTTVTRQSDVYCFRADKGTVISYTITFATAGATLATYDADVTLEVMPDPRRS